MEFDKARWSNSRNSDQIVHTTLPRSLFCFSCCAVICSQISSRFLKNIFFEGQWVLSPFCWATDTPVFDFWWRNPLDFKARVGSLICTWQRYTWYRFPEIQPWCNTYWPLHGQHGSQLLPRMHVSAEVGCWIWLGDQQSVVLTTFKGEAVQYLFCMPPLAFLVSTLSIV